MSISKLTAKLVIIKLLSQHYSSLRIMRYTDPSDSPHLTMIQVSELTKSYSDLQRGEIIAVDRLSFSAAAGEIFGLLGPNGAGKTTTLRILSTMLEPTSGTALVAGFDVHRQSDEVRKRIGFISASTGVYDRMTGWEMVEYFGLLHGMELAPLHERMATLFEQLEMQELRDRLGSKMSTGMKQKVSIARSLVHDPPVLIFDEATSGLDVMASRSLLKTVASLRDQGKCILFSTHIMREAEKLCNRAAIIHQGRLLACGTLMELREQQGDHDLEELFFQLISRSRKEDEHQPLNTSENNGA